MLKTLIIATVLLPRLAIAQQSQQLPQPGGAGWRAAPTAYRAPARRQKPFAEVRGPMTISDEDLIECWFCRLAAPEIVTKLGLQSTSELRLLWRRLKELGKLPLSSREEFGRDLNLERLIKVHREPRNDLFKKAK